MKKYRQVTSYPSMKNIIIGIASLSILIAFVTFSNRKSEKTSSVAFADNTPSQTIGSFGGTTLNFSDLSPEEQIKIYEADHQKYKALEEILEHRFTKEYFTKYASSKGIKDIQEAQEHYFKDTIKVSKAEVDKFLEANKDNPGLQKMPTAERAPRIREYLEMQGKSAALQNLIAQSYEKGDLKISYPKPVEPRLEIGVGKGHTYGSEKAPVTITEFADYQCPFCSRMVPTLREVIRKYDGKVKWVYRDFPLLQIHPQALPAAVAAKCAGEQNKYFEMHDRLYEDYAKLGEPLYLELAQKIKLDIPKFKDCLKKDSVKADVMKDLEDGSKYGVNGTPAFYVNGRKVSGGLDVAEFSRYIDEELKIKSR